MDEIVLTEDIFKELITDGTACVVIHGKHTWITLDSPKLESKMIDIIEDKWVKEYGLDAKEEEK